MLSKTDLQATIKDYPEAQEILKKKAKYGFCFQVLIINSEIYTDILSSKLVVMNYTCT